VCWVDCKFAAADHRGHKLYSIVFVLAWHMKDSVPKAVLVSGFNDSLFGVPFLLVVFVSRCIDCMVDICMAVSA
jgi:hypothetical protein